MASTDDLDSLLTSTKKWSAARKQRLNEDLTTQKKLLSVSTDGLLGGLLDKAAGLLEKDLDNLVPLAPNSALLSRSRARATLSPCPPSCSASGYVYLWPSEVRSPTSG